MKLVDVPRKAYSNKLLMEYCRKSSVHGVLYWSDRYRPYWERFLWIILVLVSLCVSGVMIRRSWIKWSDHPIAYTLGSQATHISEIPFPAFTVCSMARFQSRLVKYSRIIGKIYKDKKLPIDLELFDNLSQVCEIKNHKRTSKAFGFFPKFTNSSDIYKNLRTYQQNPDATFSVCSFVMDNITCSSLYQEIFTKHGRCYTFNGLNHRQMLRNSSIISFENNSVAPMSNWTIARGFQALRETYPLRVFQVMPQFGFTLRMKFNTSDGDYSCFGMGVGALIHFHEPSETALAFESFRAISLEHYGRISIHPEMTKTSPELHSYAPHKRMCFVQGEKYLQHFLVYNEKNCRMECLTNLTLLKCGCVFFYMPHNGSVPLCGKGSMPCYQKVIRLMDMAVMKSSEIQTEISCGCLPRCTSIEYKSNLIDYKMYLWQKNRSEIDEVLIRIYFQQTTFIHFMRSELYGLTEFLASCGGILGLFLGVSVLSLTELFYFFIVRYLWNRQAPKGPKSLIKRYPRAKVQYVKPRF